MKKMSQNFHIFLRSGPRGLSPPPLTVSLAVKYLFFYDSPNNQIEIFVPINVPIQQGSKMTSIISAFLHSFVEGMFAIRAAIVFALVCIHFYKKMSQHHCQTGRTTSLCELICNYTLSNAETVDLICKHVKGALHKWCLYFCDVSRPESWLKVLVNLGNIVILSFSVKLPRPLCWWRHFWTALNRKIHSDDKIARGHDCRVVPWFLRQFQIATYQVNWKNANAQGKIHYRKVGDKYWVLFEMRKGFYQDCPKWSWRVEMVEMVYLIQGQSFLCNLTCRLLTLLLSPLDLWIYGIRLTGSEL